MILTKFSPDRLRQSLAWRMKHLEPSLSAARTWRGQKPRVYLHNVFRHPVWDTYLTHPTLAYSPYPFAELCHWVNVSRPNLRKPHVFEVEHVAALAKFAPGRFMADWFRVYEDNQTINDKIARDQCRRVITFSVGLVDHAKLFVRPDLWHKLDYAYPAYPSQPEHRHEESGPYRILLIASRFSDKGIPEAVRAFEILRERHGPDVEMSLVSQVIPPDFILPEGITLHNVPRMSEDLKRSLYQAADVLLLPCYSETAACFTEACAYGVPIVTTRIHHSDEFVQDGVNGFLIDAPAFPYTNALGSTWRTWEDFLAHVDKLRAAGGMNKVIDDMVDRLEVLITGKVDVVGMRKAGRHLHAERFSPEARNRKLMGIYLESLGLARTT